MYQNKIKTEYFQKYTNKRYNEIKNDKTLLERRFKENNIKIKGSEILDLAAGPGIFEVIISEYQPKKITYLDLNEEYITLAKKEHKKRIKQKQDIEYIKSDLMGVKKLPKSTYDFIYCNISLFYVSDEKLFFRHIKRILKKGGIFYFTTPTKQYVKKLSFKNRLITEAIWFLNILVKKKLFPTPYHEYHKLGPKWKKAGLKEIFCYVDKKGILEIMVKK